MTIILDAMGSDNHPEPEIAGALAAAESLNEEIILVGNEEILAPKLREQNKRGLPVRIEHAPDVLTMTDKPVEGAKLKPKNSMAVGLQLVKEGRGEAFVSAGNTGGVMFNALRVLGRIKGVSRPAMAPLFPVRDGYAVVIDIGANADVRPEFLLEFAIMGSLYAEKVRHIANPRVGILSNGEEAGKGNQLVKDTFHLLENSGLNFVGNIEPKMLFAHQADVVVTDGFTGNILLKTSEAVARLLTDVIKEQIKSSLISSIGGLLVKPVLKNVKSMMDPGEVGAVPLLGIDGLVFIGHGSSDAKAIFSAIKGARTAIDAGLLAAMQAELPRRLVPTTPNSTPAAE